jgi:hypothetical protein
MKCSTDGTYRGKAVGRQVSREHDCGGLTERICRIAVVTSVGRNRWHLLATDDHHQKFIRPDQHDRRPRNRALMARELGTVRRTPFSRRRPTLSKPVR